MNKEYISVTKEIDKTLPANKEKKTYRDYIKAIEEVDILLERLEEKTKEYENDKLYL